MRLRSLIALLLAAGFARPLFAQGNLIENGGFEKFTTQDNLWDGVDNGGFLAGWQRKLPAVTEGGNVGDLAMPLSVNFADINADGLPDLVTADPAGFFRAYINRGSKTEPKFTQCEMIPLFLSRPNQPGTHAFKDDPPGNARFGTKLNLCDWSRRGVLDLVVGNYAGEVMLIPNSGTPAAPDWRQPRIIDDALLKTTRSGELWGNLFAPFGFDWDRDGRPDLLIGDGTYSANNIYVLLNKSVGARPEFGEDARHVLVFGDGREQLVPTLVDFNGDGQPDIILGDRKGAIAVYLSRGAWKPGTELPQASVISSGKAWSLGGCVAPFAADWNGDGLFDLIIGKANGRIAVALNRGTKEQPKFDAPVEVKGEDLWKQGSIGTPANWSVDAGFEKGNLYAFVAVVDATQDKDAAPAEGAHCLKAGYFPSLNRVLKKTVLDIPPSGDVKTLFEQLFGDLRPLSAERVGRETATSNFVMHNILKTQLKTGATYTLSFKIKGRGVRDGRWMLGYTGEKDNAPPKTERGERGSVRVIRDQAQESDHEGGSFSPGAQWSVVTKTFSVNFKNRALKELKTTTAAVLELRWTLMPGEGGVIYIDDVQLVEKT